MVASSLRGSPHVAPVPAQNTAVLEAIADGRTAQRVHPQPLKPDYDALAGDLFKRGWTQASGAELHRGADDRDRFADVLGSATVTVVQTAMRRLGFAKLSDARTSRDGNLLVCHRRDQSNSISNSIRVRRCSHLPRQPVPLGGCLIEHANCLSAPPGYDLFPTSALLPLQFLLAVCPEPNAFLAVQSLSIRLLRALDPLRRLWRSGLGLSSGRRRWTRRSRWRPSCLSKCCTRPEANCNSHSRQSHVRILSPSRRREAAYGQVHPHTRKCHQRPVCQREIRALKT